MRSFRAWNARTARSKRTLRTSQYTPRSFSLTQPRAYRSQLLRLTARPTSFAPKLLDKSSLLRLAVRLVGYHDSKLSSSPVGKNKTLPAFPIWRSRLHARLGDGKWFAGKVVDLKETGVLSWLSSCATEWWMTLPLGQLLIPSPYPGPSENSNVSDKFRHYP